MSWLILLLAILFINESNCADQSLQKVVAGNEKFTSNVYKQLIKTETGNLIFSGLSAEIVLSLLTSGAKGDTQSQLITGLSLPNNSQIRNQGFKELTTSLNINTDKLKLLSANKIYPADGYPILESFNKTAVNVYNSEVQSLNYADPENAADIINDWVANRTNDKIQNLIDGSSLGSSTVLVLVNALYFSGEWVHSFESYRTGLRDFYVGENETKQIDIMYTEANAKYSHCTKLKAKFLELDFKAGNISMVFILPDSKTGLTAVEKNIEKYVAPQNFENARVGIFLPKFTISTKIDFQPILKELGVTKIFSTQADLSGISTQNRLKVDFVVQKAVIDVTETGVVAAAATGVGVSTTAIQQVKYYFDANHPFFYYIKDNYSGVVLFAGRFNG